MKHPTSTNSMCASCPQGWWTINGRYCGTMKTYVEHAPYPYCADKITRG